MKTGIYETNVRKLFSTNEKEWSTEVSLLVENAYQIDRYREKIVDESRRLAEKWSKFAANILEGQTYGEPSPQIQWEITRQCALLEAHTSLFKMKMHEIISREQKDQFWAGVTEDLKTAV